MSIFSIACRILFLVAVALAKRPPVKIHIGNLIYNMTEAEVLERYTPFAKVISTIRHYRSIFQAVKKHKGFVEMPFRKQGKRAIAIFNGQSLINRLLVVRAA